ncbi:MAG: Peptide chain release factor subunit 1 [archaeon GW2011_AR20]|nr:MAG: Peptide chain release factor subunit 1 [archaeon GW2011_AR20]AQS28123.1 hypothetical protein [uncultured archaeon]MBS3160580.1 helix-turn-helix domain-containing protein [Candidatus Woesearchaeota archaeon]
METKKRQKLKRFIKELEQIRGRHTELVSVYVPADYDMIKIIQHLQQEQGTAENIKDKTTRLHVIDSLEKAIRHLRLYKKTPENGLAVFAGNIGAQEGKTDLKVWSIEPPDPIATRLYRCDQTFVIDILKEQLEVKDYYGLVVMDNREATIGILKGTLIQELNNMTSGVPGKIKAGGQCESFGTLVQLSSGEIVKIENMHNPHIVKSATLNSLSLDDSPVIDKWFVDKKQIYKITTRHPKLINECSKDHIFYVFENQKFKEKSADELKVGDCLIMPERINVKGKLQKFNVEKYYNSFLINREGRNLLIKKRKNLKLLQRELAKKLGLTQTTISYYEIARLNPSKEEMSKICNFFSLDLNKYLKNYTKPFFYKGVAVKLPNKLDKDLAQFLGYFAGDGNSEEDRITFSEQNKQVALYYKNKFGKFFNLNPRYRFREKKNYHQIRFISRPLVRFIKEEFPEIKDKNNPEIPQKILISKDDVVAGFLRGIFDAEGHASLSNGEIGIGSINKTLIGQIHLLLMRFSIISSFTEWDNRQNPYSKKPIFKLKISEKESISNFIKFIGFSSDKKAKKLKKLLENKKGRSNVRQILPVGLKIKEALNNYKIRLDSLRTSNFLNNQGMISKAVFKNRILNKIRVRDKELYNQLKKFYESNLLPVKISKIEIINKPLKMVDISIKNQNFIANGLIVHNSQQRFARLREGAAHDFYQRIAEYVNKEFYNKPEIKGIILGGPGPTKYTFLDGDYLNNEVKKKVVGVKDLSYTGEFGLHELVDKSHDLLAKEAVTEEKNLLNRFFVMLAKEPEKTTYGKDRTKKALEYGAVDLLLLSEDLDDETTDELTNIAEKFNTKVEIISIDTNEGKQLKELGRIASILRFALNQ